MLVRTERDVDSLLADVEQADETYIDLETSGLDPWKDFMVGAAIKPRGKPARYLSIAHRGWQAPIRSGAAFAEVIHRAHSVANHNLYGFDGLFMDQSTHAWRDRGGRDSMLALRLVNENRSLKLKDWAGEALGGEAILPERLLMELGRQKGWTNVKEHMAELTAEEAAEYACQDVILVEHLLDHVDPVLDGLGLSGIADEYYEYARMLAEMQADGLTVDWGRVEECHEQAKAHEHGRRMLTRSKTGDRNFNPASHPQCQKALKTWTSEDWMLQAMAREGSDLAQALVDWRRAKKACEFYEGYLEHRKPDGKLHPAFRFVRTGRISYKRPNLHSTPHYSNVYRNKECFIADPGTKLVLFDWRQVEARLCAHYNAVFEQDNQLAVMFRDDVDFHAFTAMQLGYDRSAAKTLNYASFYGMGHVRYSRKYGVTETEAKERLKTYHETIPGPRQLYQRMMEIATERHQIRLWDGSYRRLPGYGQNWPKDASNSLLQGGVGSMARRAALRLDGYLDRSRNERWLLQIHDALMCQVDAGRGADFLRGIKRTMEDFHFRVPMVVDVKVGDRWSDLKELKL